jgi:hypothetical protein
MWEAEKIEVGSPGWVQGLGGALISADVPAVGKPG